MKRRRGLLTHLHEAFHGALSPEKAGQRIRNYAQSKCISEDGCYLICLPPFFANQLCLCHAYIPVSVSTTEPYYTSASIAFSHKTIYRTPFGYSFSAKNEAQGFVESLSTEPEYAPIPSLFSCCAWLICCDTGLQQKSINFPEEVRAKIEDVRNLVSVWQIALIPNSTEYDAPVPPRFGANPTLTYLIQRNRFCKFPVPPNTEA